MRLFSFQIASPSHQLWPPVVAAICSCQGNRTQPFSAAQTRVSPPASPDVPGVPAANARGRPVFSPNAGPTRASAD